MRATAIALLALLAGNAIAQKAERPEVKVGDEWRFAVYYTEPSTKPSRTWIITSVAASGIEGTENGDPLKLTPDLNVLDSPNGTQSNPNDLRFPLEVGKRWRYDTDWHFRPKNSRGKHAIEVLVVAWEKIKTAAGEFDAFKVIATAKQSGTSPIGSKYDGELIRTYWYAPAARAVVKLEVRNPYLGPSNVELVDFKLKP